MANRPRTDGWGRALPPLPFRAPRTFRALGRLLALGLAFILGTGACQHADDGVPVPGREGAVKTAALERADRRLFDGAPPVIPHAPAGGTCTSCHNQEGMAVEGMGFSPPSPHGESRWGKARGLGALGRCQQCHVYRQDEAPWRGNTFAGLRQDLRRGRRLYDGAPPVIPHRVFLRESCAACHTGPAAREEIRTSHPERLRCQQCHLEQITEDRLEQTARKAASAEGGS